MIAVYVDDIILAGRSDKCMKEVKDAIAERFTVKDLGELHHFLGVKVIQDKESNSIWIGQETYARESTFSRIPAAQPRAATILEADWLDTKRKESLDKQDTRQQSVL